MISKYTKIVLLIVEVLVIAIVCYFAIKPYKIKEKEISIILTTNWVGTLVIGKEFKFASMVNQVAPTVINEVEIGLRSDGVLLWKPIVTD